MKLQQLQLHAYGPFTDKIINFDHQEPGLHIIFGNNEAGKSSCLRALKALFYGFPKTTADNFLHSYEKLLVGGTLTRDDGKELSFQRRKRLKADLLDGDGKPIDGEVLKSFMQGVETELFDTLYGISHETLVQGGEEILAQKGALGKTLFAAGAGLASIKKVSEQLESEAGKIYKARGQVQELNIALKKYKELQQQIKNIQLSAKEWSEKNNLLTQNLSKRKELEKKRLEKDQELRRLQRLEKAIPEIKQLHSLKQQSELLGDIPAIDSQFSKRFQQVEQQLQLADRDLDSHTNRRESLQQHLGTISVNALILSKKETINELVQKLGEYNKGQQDKPIREGQRVSLRREAASFLASINPTLSLEETESLQPLINRKKTIQELVRQHERLTQTLHHQENLLSTMFLEKEDLGAKLAMIPGLEPSHLLKKTIADARKAGDIDTQIDKLDDEISLIKQQCSESLLRMGLWQKNLSSLMTTPLPLQSTVGKFKKQLEFIDNRINEIKRGIQLLQSEEQKVLSELNTMKSVHDIPTEDDLKIAREKRQHDWHLIYQILTNQQQDHTRFTEDAKNDSLTKSYEQHVSKADEIVDSLRQHADHVSQRSLLQKQLEDYAHQNLELTAELKKLVSEHEQVKQEWENLWHQSGITPLTPAEMAEWLVAVDKLTFRWEEIQKKQNEYNLLASTRKKIVNELSSELEKLSPREKVSGMLLAPLLADAEESFTSLQEQSQQLHTIKKQLTTTELTIRKTELDISNTKQEVQSWKKAWRKVVNELQHEESVTPTAVLDHLENLEKCFARLKEAKDLNKRIMGIEKDASQLQEEVESLFKDLMPGQPVPPIEPAIILLREQLENATNNYSRQQQLTQEIVKLDADIKTARGHVQASNSKMQLLLDEAGCTSVEQLPVVIEKVLSASRLLEKIDDVELLLIKIGAGISIETLIAQADGVDPDTLPAKITTLNEEIEKEINPAINSISQEIGQQELQVAAMDGSHEAAQLAENMEHTLATIRRLAKQYGRLRLASGVMNSAIDTYRKEHQEPILEIGSEYYQTLTLNSFSGLRTDIDDNGELVLVGLRPDGSNINVQAMSTGSRDQLYLALRLATIQWRLKNHESFPFIVDDILINFDDYRSEATLKSLAELAKKNQVILFTHHQLVADTALSLQKQYPILLHSL